MHNLGLGDLEFDPGHTVDQHRPDGFKVPDIDAVEEDERNATHHSQRANESVHIKMEDDLTESKNEKVQTIPSDYESAITWKSEDFEDATFASLHNPKHFHHKDHSHRKYLFVDIFFIYSKSLLVLSRSGSHIVMVFY